jgi:hypothetical protein
MILIEQKKKKPLGGLPLSLMWVLLCDVVVEMKG